MSEHAFPFAKRDDASGSSTAREPEERERVAVTPEAAQLLRDLWADHGPLMFHQSGGCCDGSSPMCFPDGEFLTSEADIHLGDLELGEGRQVPVWMSREQFAVWSHTHITIDLVKGRGAGFSLEAPTGHRFLIRSRLMDPPAVGAPTSVGAPTASVGAPATSVGVSATSDG